MEYELRVTVTVDPELAASERVDPEFVRNEVEDMIENNSSWSADVQLVTTPPGGDMDPNANLTEQLKLASDILVNSDIDADAGNDDAIQLAALVTSLDEWIRKGGFIPAAWANPPGGTWVELLQLTRDLLEMRGDYTLPTVRMAELVIELGKAMGWTK